MDKETSEKLIKLLTKITALNIATSHTVGVRDTPLDKEKLVDLITSQLNANYVCFFSIMEVLKQENIFTFHQFFDAVNNELIAAGKELEKVENTQPTTSEEPNVIDSM